MKMFHFCVIMATILLGGIGLGARAVAPPPEPLERSLERWWAELDTEDPARSEQVKVCLAARPAQTVPLLKKHLRPITFDARQVSQWLVDLDNDLYAIREQASRALEELEDAIEPQARQTLAGNPSLEVRRRIERLLQQMRNERLSPSSQRRRALAAIEVLERIGNPAARQVLALLAKGAPKASLTIEAEAALERLTR